MLAGGPRRAHHGRVLDGAYVEQLRALGLDQGLAALGVADAQPFAGTRSDLEERKRAGLHGSMQFTYRNPARSTDPSATLAGVRALVVGALRYQPTGRLPRAELHDAPGSRTRPTGRVARYARRDHYARLRAALDAVAGRLRADGWTARVVADSNALVDREAARRAGLGWYGKSSNLLVPGAGSWFVLGSVLTDAPLPAADDRVPDGCGPCRRCLDACPTGAIVAPGVVDARRCLAWTVQAEGAIPRELRVPLGDRLYGCDDCQEVCPPNLRPSTGEADPDGGAEDQAGGAAVDLLDLLAADDATLLDRHGRWYIPGREPRYLRRNALVALANSGDPTDRAVTDAVREHLAHPDGLLRAHAVWAARRLGRSDLLDPALADDPDPEVRAELAAEPPPVAAGRPA